VLGRTVVLRGSSGSLNTGSCDDDWHDIGQDGSMMFATLCDTCGQDADTCRQDATLTTLVMTTLVTLLK
jgi:hypothetical protein